MGYWRFIIIYQILSTILLGKSFNTYNQLTEFNMLKNEKIKLFQKFLEYLQGNEDLTSQDCELIELYGEEFDLWIDYIMTKEKPPSN